MSRRHAKNAAKPLVSVIVPTHNRAHCLPRALDSIYAQQGLGEGFEIETVVVDDGSSDGTAEVARRYPGLRYVRLASQSGVSTALNAGLRASMGDFVTFLGDDDEWLSHKLRVQVPLLARHPDVGVVYGQTVVRLGDRRYVYPDAGHAPSGWVFFDMLLDNFCGHHAAALMRRAVLEATGAFDETLLTCEDYDLSLRIARQFPFLFSTGVVTVYNLSPQGSFLRRVASGLHDEDRARVIDKALSTLPDSDEYAAIRQAVRARSVLVTATARALAGDLTGAQEKLLSSLRTYPWAVRHEWGWRCVRDVAHEHVHSGRSPIVVVRDLYVQVKAATGPHRVSFSRWLRLLARLSIAAARRRFRIASSSAPA